MKPVHTGERHKLKIERLAVGGRGVARLDGLVVFVSDVAPGDEVEAEITLAKKNFAEARLVHVLTPGPSRITPPCPVAGVCGGCSWQQVSYDEQLRQKRSLVQESLRKFSKFEIGEDLVAPTVASPLELRYRNRIQLHHSGAKVGYFKRGTHEIVDIDDCPIAEEPLAREIPKLKRELAQEKPGRIEVFRNKTGQTKRRDIGHEKNGEEDGGPAFGQVNSGQNENLIRAVVELFTGLKAHVLYDLYAGSGNFTLPLAQALPETEVTAVELNAEAVERGRALSRDLQRVTFVRSSVDDWLRGAKLGENSAVLLDPPRTGCGVAVMADLATKQPMNIAYVSCHPVTLARDLGALHGQGYDLVRVQPFDMFPQTDHVEILAHLRRR